MRPIIEENRLPMMHRGPSVIKGSLCEKVHRPRRGGSVSLNQLISDPLLFPANLIPPFSWSLFSWKLFAVLSLPHRHVQWGFLAFQKCIQAFRSAEKQNGHQGEEADLVKKQRMRDGGGMRRRRRWARNSWHLLGFLSLSKQRTRAESLKICFNQEQKAECVSSQSLVFV